MNLKSEDCHVCTLSKVNTGVDVGEVEEQFACWLALRFCKARIRNLIVYNVSCNACKTWICNIEELKICICIEDIKLAVYKPVLVVLNPYTILNDIAFLNFLSVYCKVFNNCWVAIVIYNLTVFRIYTAVAVCDICNFNRFAFVCRICRRTIKVKCAQYIKLTCILKACFTCSYNFKFQSCKYISYCKVNTVSYICKVKCKESGFVAYIVNNTNSSLCNCWILN